MKDFNLNEVIDNFKIHKQKESSACVIISAPVAEENVSKVKLCKLFYYNLILFY